MLFYLIFKSFLKGIASPEHGWAEVKIVSKRAFLAIYERMFLAVFDAVGVDHVGECSVGNLNEAFERMLDRSDGVSLADEEKIFRPYAVRYLLKRERAAGVFGIYC